ncbi:MAG: PPC domain-containing protein, partial [Treponema sp.]|nr:PPC domain-containing protein [Treponema sp.]
ENDEDFFLLVPDRDGMLVMETTGNIDTCMELYDAASREMLSDDDDGGSGGNARIRHSAAAGSRYIARVRGFDHETGGYGFRAWLAEPVRPDEYENDDDFDSAGEIGIGTAQRHTFTTGDDEDWVKFVISREGRYVIRARGVNSGRLDTCIELYGSDGNSIGEDDDGGEEYDSRLAVNLQAGNYFLKVKCLDSEPDEPYTIRVDAE